MTHLTQMAHLTQTTHLTHMTYMTHMTHVTGTLAGERAIIVALVYDVSCGFLHRG